MKGDAPRSSPNSPKPKNIPECIYADSHPALCSLNTRQIPHSSNSKFRGVGVTALCSFFPPCSLSTLHFQLFQLYLFQVKYKPQLRNPQTVRFQVYSHASFSRQEQRLERNSRVTVSAGGNGRYPIDASKRCTLYQNELCLSLRETGPCMIWPVTSRNTWSSQQGLDHLKGTGNK